MGLAYFEQIIALQKRYNPLNKVIHNDLQTNGVLLNEAWCQFLKRHDFFVGLSIDGPSFIHDHYRQSRNGRPTLDKVKTAADLLKQFEIPFATLTCVTKHSARYADEVYSFLRDDIQSLQMQFIPIIDREEITQNRQCIIPLPHRYSVTSEAWGTFLTTIFDRWYQWDIGRVYIPLFEDCMAVLLGHLSSSCVTSKECGRALAIMPNGALYSCDHYVDSSHELGNIHTTSLAKMARCERQSNFAKAKSKTLSPTCQQCQYLRFCYGGCPKDRLSIDGHQPAQHHLCSGNAAFYSHAIPKLQQLATKLYSQ